LSQGHHDRFAEMGNRPRATPILSGSGSAIPKGLQGEQVRSPQSARISARISSVGRFRGLLGRDIGERLNSAHGFPVMRWYSPRPASEDGDIPLVALIRTGRAAAASAGRRFLLGFGAETVCMDLVYDSMKLSILDGWGYIRRRFSCVLKRGALLCEPSYGSLHPKA